MPLTFHPKPGMVLMCDFNTGFVSPEMIKKRPVVVVSPRPRRSNQLCTIVPLSTTRPAPVEPHHHQMDPRSLPGKFAGNATWAKCDMLATVSLDRLDRVFVGKERNGKRLYVAQSIISEDFLEIQRGILAAIGLSGLTKHL